MPLVKLGIGASLAGNRPFADDSPWNTAVDQEPVDPRSDELIALLAHDEYADTPDHVVGLRAEFGSSLWKGATIGLPYQVVGEAQKPLPILPLASYADESDQGLWPIPITAPVEGAGSNGKTGIDRHVIVLQRDPGAPNGLGRLYELYKAQLATVTFEGKARQVWCCYNAASWDLNGQGCGERPAGWTSADAAGLPIFPGLARYDEVAAGAVRHALRFTATHTRRAYAHPASHFASSFTAENPPDPNVPRPIKDLLGCPAAEIADRLPPMGLRVRLRAGFDVGRFPRPVQVILRALQTHGMILADNGMGGAITGAPHKSWNDAVMGEIGGVKMTDFEVVRMGEPTVG